VEVAGNGIPIDEIKSSVKIWDIIEKYYQDEIKLRKSGDVYKGYCPFHKHNFDTPSFVVWPKTNKWHCFTDGEGGDVIDFLMKKENLEFKEACKMGADEAGIAYEIVPPNKEHEAYKDRMDEHSRRYWRNLQQSPEALHYLMNQRKLTQATINQFRLGLVPVDEYKVRTDMGGISGRIAFPILESKDIKYAKCIGMGYRQFDPKDTGPKYINDKNRTDDRDPLKGVFIKGETLYGYPWAHQTIRKNNFAIVVEGYIDVISMHQAGLTNTVGCLGTALTEHQMDTIRKMTRNIILFLDGDKAGIDNMLKVLPQLFEKDFNVLIMIAENNMDAADVCLWKNFDGNAIRQYITDNAKAAMSVVIERETKAYEQIVIRERLKAVRAVSALIEKIPAAERKVYEDLLYKRLDIKGGC
jgi:DNA primase